MAKPTAESEIYRPESQSLKVSPKVSPSQNLRDQVGMLSVVSRRLAIKSESRGERTAIELFLHRVSKVGCRGNASHLEEALEIESSSCFAITVKKRSENCLDAQYGAIQTSRWAEGIEFRSALRRRSR